jgi:hypothetical protein
LRDCASFGAPLLQTQSTIDSCAGFDVRYDMPNA